MPTFENSEVLSSVRTKINDAITTVDDLTTGTTGTGLKATIDGVVSSAAANAVAIATNASDISTNADAILALSVGGGEDNPTQVTLAERNDGDETGLRSFSPEDVKAMANLHGGGGGSLPQVTPSERTAGIETGLRSFAPEDVSVMAGVHGGEDNPSQVTPTERNSGTETALRSFAPEDVAVMAVVHGGEDNPSQVTPTERTAGTETALRSFSPEDVASMAGIHGGGGGSALNPTPDDYGTNTTPGTTDMTTAFQSALDTGGAVDLKPNTTYAVTSLDAVTGNRINLNGATVFQIAASTGPVIDMVGVDDFALFNGTVDGNKANQTNDGNFGLKSGTTTSNRVRIDGVHFKDCYSGSLKMNYCDDLMVTGCSFRNGGASSSASRNEVAVGLSASVSIIGNNFYGSLLTGADNVACIIDTSGGNAVIQGNHFENYESEVIQVVRYNAGAEDTGVNRIERCVISGNIINGSNGAAPYCIQVGENCQNVIVTSNVCYGAAEGIRIGQYVRDIVVSDNICTGNSGSGITVLGKTYGKLIISNNKCDNNDSNGISLDGNYADTIEVVQVIGNMCTNNCQNTVAIRGGIRISASITTGLFANNVCTDNQGTKTQLYGLVLQGGTWANMVISGNNLAGNLTASSYVNVGRANFIAYGNAEDTPSLDDFTVAASGNVTVRNYLDVTGGATIGGTEISGTGYISGAAGAEFNGFFEVIGTGGRFNGDLFMTGNKISGLGTPTLTDDAATKGYVDNSLSGYATQSYVTSAVSGYATKSYVTSTVSSTPGDVAINGFLTTTSGCQIGGYADFNGNVDLNGNNILAVKRITLTPQSSNPGGSTGALAVSNGTASTNNFGAGGAGLYELTSSGQWAKR